MKTELIELKIKHEDLFLYFKDLNNIINFDINITSKNNFKFLNIINNLSHKELKLIKQYIPYNFYIIMSLYYYKLRAKTTKSTKKMAGALPKKLFLLSKCST